MNKLETKIYIGKKYLTGDGSAQSVDPFDPQDKLDSFLVEGTLPAWMRPQDAWLLVAMNPIEVPEGYIGLVQLRSTFARHRLISPATYADAGFKGFLTLEVYNASFNDIILHPGMHMFNVVYVPAPYEPPYQGKYQDQPPIPVGPKQLDHTGGVDFHISYTGYHSTATLRGGGPSYIDRLSIMQETPEEWDDQS